MIKRRHVVGAILLHFQRARVDVALATAKRDLLAVVEGELPVAQRLVHADAQFRIRTFHRAQVATVFLGDWRHAGPFRVVIGDPHLLNRRQVHDADFKVRRGERAGLDVVLHIFRQAGQDELVVRGAPRRIRLRLHRDWLPAGFLIALVAGKQAHPLRLEPDDLCGYQLVAVAAHGYVAGGHPQIIEWRGLGPSPKQ